MDSSSEFLDSDDLITRSNPISIVGTAFKDEIIEHTHVLTPVAKVRKYFPESWIWSVAEIE